MISGPLSRNIDSELNAIRNDDKKSFYLARNCHDHSDPAAAKNAVTELLLP